MFFHHIKFKNIDFRDLGWTNQAAAPNQLEADESSIFIRVDTLTEVSYVYSGKPQPSICFKILTYLFTCLFWENGENIDIHTLEFRALRAEVSLVIDLVHPRPRV